MMVSRVEQSNETVAAENVAVAGRCGNLNCDINSSADMLRINRLTMFLSGFAFF